MPLATSNITHLWASLLVEELVRSGVDCFFVAPGSRSTPLTTAAARHEGARVVLHIDERGSAFAALGYGRSAGRPAAWITTSGTAVANGLPAAVEAATDGVPMLLLTADRPPELRDTGANQTVDQVKLFGDYARWQFDLPAPTTDAPPEMVLTTAAQAVYHARRHPPGPVHLNCMFRKPLDPAADGRDYTEYLAGLHEWRAGQAPYTRRPVAPPSPPPGTAEALAETLAAAAERGLVVCGRLDSARAARAAVRAAAALGWPLVPDVTSRLRFVAAGPVVPYADQALASLALREGGRPASVLHLGGRSLSKRVRGLIAESRPDPYVVARPDPRRLDPDHRVTAYVETGVEAFCDALVASLPEHPTPAGEQSVWTHASDAAEAVMQDFETEAEALSEPLVARLVSRLRPPGSALVLGSSMPVRDVNRYAAASGAASGPLAPVFANRGASGIDGTIATAVGVGEGASEDTAPVTLLVGDLALLHDLNSLALLGERPVTVVVLNNSGGGIFHFLPIAEHADVFEPYFTTPHERSFEQAAAFFGVSYDCPATPEAFADVYRARSREPGPALVEVRTDREDNRALHDHLEARIARAVDECLS